MYHVEVSSSENYTFKAKANNSEFTIDAKGSGISPLDALLAGLGSCIGVYIKKYADGLKIPLKNFKITLDAEFTKEKPIYFKDIFININLNGLKLEEAQQNGLMAFIKNCPVHNTLKNNPNIDIKIT